MDHYGYRQVADLLERLTYWIREAETLNEPGEKTRSRKLSIAITESESVKHWIKDILDEYHPDTEFE